MNGLFLYSLLPKHTNPFERFSVMIYNNKVYFIKLETKPKSFDFNIFIFLIISLNLLSEFIFLNILSEFE